MLNNILEAVFFAAGDGIELKEFYIALANTYTKKEIDTAVAELVQKYSGSNGIHLIRTRNLYQFQSNPDYGVTVADILQEVRERELSKTLLQGLSIIAYKQPITHKEINSVRGVYKSDRIIAMLLRLNLIKRSRDSHRSAYEYTTTDEFLKKFGLKDLSELPDYDAILDKVKVNTEKRSAESQSLFRSRSISDNPKTEELISKLIKDSGGVSDEDLEEDYDDVASDESEDE
ncbi:MAG: SMC-Scp complex subunit ScpB [Christensenellaceae bacterium]|jgi:segregation and condensation protein B|nr:SMC-Scp complex subunit ScpB [Christensenellaceae bacterium]